MELPTNLMNINGLIEVDTAPEPERLKKVLVERLCAYRRFRQKVVEPSVGRSYWVDDPYFEVERHLIFEQLENPTMEGLLARVGGLLSVALDRHWPLWEFRCFPEVDGKAFVLVRLHHAIADGMALMRVLLGLTDKSRNQEPERSEPRAQKRIGAFQRARQAASRLLHQGHDLFLHPHYAGRLAQHGFGAIKATARLLAMGADTDTVLRGELTTKKVLALSPRMSLGQVKRVGKACGSTVNDVLMTCLALALGDYLRRGGPLDSATDLRVVIPVDLRGGEVDSLGNRFGLVFLELPVGLESPLDCLKVVHERMVRLKNSYEAIVVFELLSAAGMLPAELEQTVVKLFGDKATAVVTNLPGPQHQLYFAGSRIESVMYWVPQSGRLGVGVSILSYNGDVRVGVATDASLVPDPENLVEPFTRAFQSLVSVTLD